MMEHKRPIEIWTRYDDMSMDHVYVSKKQPWFDGTTILGQLIERVQSWYNKR